MSHAACFHAAEHMMLAASSVGQHMVLCPLLLAHTVSCTNLTQPIRCISTRLSRAGSHVVITSSMIGLCGVSLIWCGLCHGHPAIGFTWLLCVWPQKSLPLLVFHTQKNWSQPPHDMLVHKMLCGCWCSSERVLVFVDKECGTSGVSGGS